jgi:hypothetical protein
MDRTTVRDRVASPALHRLAATSLAGSLLILTVAAPANAQGFGDGTIYAVADCNLATKTANVSVVVMEPSTYANSGLVFYVEVYAKSRSTNRWDFIRGGQTGTVKTWSLYNPNPFVSSQQSWMNSPATIFRAAFSGRTEDYYDIYIKYWYATPGSKTWTGQSGFTVAGDPHSSITITSNDGFGNLSSPASNCYL